MAGSRSRKPQALPFVAAKVHVMLRLWQGTLIALAESPLTAQPTYLEYIMGNRDVTTPDVATITTPIISHGPRVRACMRDMILSPQKKR